MKSRLTLIKYVILTILTLCFLAAGSVTAFYQFASPITARVNIQANTKKEQLANNFTVVTGQTDLTKQQVTGARMISTTAIKSATVNATGVGSVGGTKAHGTMEMELMCYAPYTNCMGSVVLSISAGAILQEANGIAIVADQGATLNVVNGNTPVIPTFPATVLTVGASGNIPVNQFQVVEQTTVAGIVWHALFVNVTDFTGGTDPTHYAYVQQADITQGQHNLEVAAKQQATTSLLTQAKTGEQWVQNASCTVSDSSDAKDGDTKSSFTVTDTASCTGEVFDPTNVQMAAKQALTSLATQNLGDTYQLTGLPDAMVSSIQLTDKAQGTMTVTVVASGWWLYHPSITMQKILAKQISGKSIGDAQKLLMHQGNIVKVTITLTHIFWIWNTIPNDTGKITFTIQGS